MHDTKFPVPHWPTVEAHTDSLAVASGWVACTSPNLRFWLRQVCSWSELALSVCHCVRRTYCGSGCSPPLDLCLKMRCNEPGSANWQPEADPPSQLNQVKSSQKSAKRRMESLTINVCCLKPWNFETDGYAAWERQYLTKKDLEL